MGLNTILILLTIALVICCVLAIVDAIRTKKSKDKVQTVLLLICTAFCGIGAILTSSSNTITIMVPELKTLANENRDLTEEVKKLEKQIVDKDSQLTDMSSELKEVSQSLSNNAMFLDYNLYLNDEKLNINTSESIAKINGEYFFSQDVLQAITQEEVKEDKANSMIYIGKYPDEKIYLLSACPPFDASYSFRQGTDGSYKLRGVTYTDGIVLQTHSDDLNSVSFNLKGKYSELTFHIGRVDDSGESTLSLTPTLDGTPGNTYVYDENTDPDTEQTIPLNGAKILTLKWNGESGTGYTQYGLTNIKIK